MILRAPLRWLAVETDDGYERGVEIIGPAESGKAEQMRVRFPDGTEDDWDEDELDGEFGRKIIPRGYNSILDIDEEIF